ncbi:MAG: hypothetical protein HZY79_02240 [Rhodoblastus sp.]|nr:MAG: hypothetical protein HZY79_02240 [Rhodoblastus sp.]
MTSLKLGFNLALQRRRHELGMSQQRAREAAGGPKAGEGAMEEPRRGRQRCDRAGAEGRARQTSRKKLSAMDVKGHESFSGGDLHPSISVWRNHPRTLTNASARKRTKH